MRWFVLLLSLGIVAWGVWAWRKQPIDAYPDISGQMVQIITVFPGRAPEEVERQVTIPVENAMLGVPRVEPVRSLDQYPPREPIAQPVHETSEPRKAG